MMEKKSAFEPKTVRCAICHETVSKRSTLPINQKDRVCKTHLDAKEMNEKWVQSQVQAKAAPLKTEQKKERKQNLRPKEKFQARPLTCFCCEQHGIFIADFFFKMAIEMEKMKIETGQFPNMFGPEFPNYLKSKLSDEDRRAIAVLDVSQINQDYGTDVLAKLVKMMKDRRPLIINTTLASGRLCFCIECLTKNGLAHLTEPKRKPEITLEQMFNIGSAMQDTLEDLAKAELEDDQKDSKAS